MDGYVLLLENDNYYVGITNDYNNRINSHLNNCGSSWTKLHKPIKVIEQFIGGKDNEREKTLEYMRKYGWDKVRGAGWTAVKIKKPLLL